MVLNFPCNVVWFLRYKLAVASPRFSGGQCSVVSHFFAVRVGYAGSYHSLPIGGCYCAVGRL